MKILFLWVVILSAVWAGSAQKGLVAAKHGNYSKAYELWKPLNSQTDPQVQYMLGYMLDHGYGVEQDKAAAISWYEKSASQGYAKAEFKLGIKLLRANPKRAWKLIESAAEHGYPPAQYKIAEMYLSKEDSSDNEIKALEWFEKAYRNGISTADHYIESLTKKLSLSEKERNRKAADRQNSHHKRNDTKKIAAQKTARPAEVGEAKAQEGIVELFYPKGNRHIRRSSKGSVLHETIWHPNGWKRASRKIVSGKMEGEATVWYDNGHMKSHALYQKGKLEGVLETWYRNGHIRSRAVYHENLLDGKAEVWYANGNKKEVSHFIKGLPNGEKSGWYPNGQKRFEVHYRLGKIEGAPKIWLLDGSLQTVEPAVAGSKR